MKKITIINKLNRQNSVGVEVCKYLGSALEKMQNVTSLKLWYFVLNLYKNLINFQIKIVETV